MAVRVLNTGAISRKTKRLIGGAFKDKALAERVGRGAVSHVKRRTRDGLGEDAQPLKPLAASTIKSREELAKYNRTSKFFIAPFSNLHFTGQLINAIKFAVKTKGANVVEVYVDNSQRKKLKTKSGKPSKARATTNSKVAKYVQDAGRKFMRLDESGRQTLRQIVVRHVKRWLREQRRRK